jgi:hypothetical protein
MLHSAPHPEVYAYEVTPDWTQALLFNTGEHTRKKRVSLSGDPTETGGLGLSADDRYHVFDFWSDAWLGCFDGTDAPAVSLRPGETAMLSVRRVADGPQFVSTNRHIMQGLVECRDVEWNAETRRFTGEADVVGGEPFVLTVATNGVPLKDLSADAGTCAVRKREESDDLLDFVFTTDENRRVRFEAR